MINNPTIEKHLLLSTCHIRKKDVDLLSKGSVYSNIVFYEYEYGWYIIVSGNYEEIVNIKNNILDVRDYGYDPETFEYIKE